MLSLKYMDLVKCMEQWLQLLNFFFLENSLYYIFHLIFACLLPFTSLWSQASSVSLYDLLTNEQGFLSYSTCEQPEVRTAGGAENYLNQNKNNLRALLKSVISCLN